MLCVKSKSFRILPGHGLSMHVAVSVAFPEQSPWPATPPWQNLVLSLVPFPHEAEQFDQDVHSLHFSLSTESVKITNKVIIGLLRART